MPDPGPKVTLHFHAERNVRFTDQGGAPGLYRGPFSAVNKSMDHARVESSKTMLILKAHAHSMAATEVFLRNRGWKLFITTDVKEALLKLVEQKFSYVLLSVDHPNKKTPLLPQLIRHKFSCTVMTYAENPSTTSYNRLNTSDSEYKIYAPVTGPAVERCITKYLRDLQTRSLMTIKPEETSTLGLLYRQPHEEPRIEETGIFVKGKGLSRGFGSVQNTGSSPQEIQGVVQQARGKDPEYQQRHLLQRKKRSDALDTIIARGTQLSLLETVDFQDGLVHHQVENTANSGCIVVESERFSGYIVTALGHNETLSEEFMTGIKKKLFKYLKDNGEHLTESEAMDIKLKPVAFEPWALEYADFLRTSVHRGDEVAVAFFPRRPVHVPLENSARRDMATIRLMDLKGDREVNFDLYIYLATNKKYVLYTPQGGVFYQKQLDRLKQQGVTHMHVPKTATEAVTKYSAQNYLNDLVEAFDQSEFAPPRPQEKAI